MYKITNFHNTRSRIAVLMRHFNEDLCGCADEVTAEIEKINNVLFDKDIGEAKTVIDLRGHNLVRTRSQLALADDIFEKLGAMNSIVADITKIPFKKRRKSVYGTISDFRRYSRQRKQNILWQTVH